MPHRTIGSDAKGPYIKYLRETFRPSGTSVLFKPGDPVSVSLHRNRSQLRVWSAGAWTGAEHWKSLAPVPRPDTKAPITYKGQKRIAKYVGGANLSVILSDNGTLKVSNSTRKGDIYLALNAGMSLTVEQWQQLVDEINEAISDVFASKVTTALKAELELEEEMESIRSKYQ